MRSFALGGSERGQTQPCQLTRFSSELGDGCLKAVLADRRRLLAAELVGLGLELRHAVLRARVRRREPAAATTGLLLERLEEPDERLRVVASIREDLEPDA